MGRQNYMTITVADTVQEMFNDFVSEKGMTKTELRKNIGFGTNALAKMSKGEYISLETIDKICLYLNCKIEDVIEIIPD